jgi:hypothetical protein
MTGVVFFAVVIGAPLILGLPFAVMPSLDRLSIAAKASLAWAMGCGLLAVILTLVSAVGATWEPWWIMLACIAAIVSTSIMTSKKRATSPAAAVSPRIRLSAASLCFLIVAGGGLFTFAFGFATSADLAYFWGVKAAHFALERGVDFELLRQPYMIHLHPNYTPLWPVLLGWGAMIAGSLPWLAVPPLTWICLTATAAIVFSVLEERLGARAASAVACLWYAVLTTMAATSFSGGNADGLLLLFLTLALAVILTEPKDGPSRLRWLAAVALAGAVFTKSEGSVATVLIVAGTAIRDVVWRKRAVLREMVFLIAPAAAMVTFWILVRKAHDIRLTDPIRETAFHLSFEHVELILKVCGRLLITGAAAIGLLVPLITLSTVTRRSMDRAIPAAVTAVGIFSFALVYYLHAVGDPLQLIVWTFPRLIQPAISASILGCGVVVFSLAREHDSDTATATGADR